MEGKIASRKAKSKKTAAADMVSSVISEIEDDELEDLEEIDDSFDRAQENEVMELQKKAMQHNTHYASSSILVEEAKCKSKSDNERREDGKKEEAHSFNESDNEKTLNIAWNKSELRPGSKCHQEGSKECSDMHFIMDSVKDPEKEDMEIVNEDKLEEDINEIADYIKYSGLEEVGGIIRQMDNIKKSNAKDSPTSLYAYSSKRKRKPTAKKISIKKTKLDTVAIEPIDASLISKRQVKAIQNWRKVLKLPSPLDDRLTTSQIFNNSIPSYIPHVPKGTSERLISYLTERDVEMQCCPGCKDRFVLPTTFLQHVFRKSVSITFSCQGCRQTLNFRNRCHLKIHILSHLEVDGVGSVNANFVDVSPLDEKELELGFIDDSYRKELDLAHQTCSANRKNLIQCTECMLSIDKNELQKHFERKEQKLDCSQCPIILTNSCSFSAHARIHQKTIPLVCPECGTLFKTYSVFQAHVESFCHHDSKILVLECRVCLKKGLPHSFIDARDILSHVYDTHVKLYYKCSSCPKAFDTKTAIYDHRDQKHPQEEGEKSDFSLLYKASFLRAPGNLFSTRKSFEEKMLKVSRHWSASAMFKCATCRVYFKCRADIAQHNRKKCVLQFGDASVNRSKLFVDKYPDVEKGKKLEGLISELKSLLEEDCACCGNALIHLRSHIQEQSSSNPEWKRHKKSPKLADRTTIRPSRKEKPARTSYRESISSSLSLPSPFPLSSSQETSNASVIPIEEKNINHVKAEIKQEENIEEVNVLKKKKAVRSKRSSISQKNEIKPFVESLGKDVLSTRRVLAFNQLNKKALTLGSSVADNQRMQRKDRSKHCCGLCDFSTDLRESFHTHIRIHRPREVSPGEYFQCKECGMSFASEPAWRKHLFLLHRIKRPGPSDYCSDLTQKDPFSFSEDDSSSELPLTIDEGEVFRPRTNVCTVCARAFSTPLELRRHFRGHGMAFLMTAKNK